MWLESLQDKVHVQVPRKVQVPHKVHCLLDLIPSSVCKPSEEETIGSLVSDWNHALEETTSKVKAWNAELMSWFEQGQMSAEAVLAGFEPVPKLLQKPTSQWCRMWKRKWGWSTLTRSHEDGQSLGFDHPDMACSRVAFHSLFSDHQVDPRLVLNYDQLWRNAWSTSKFKVSYKHRLFAGATGEREAVEPRVSKKINQPKGARRSITVAGHKKVKHRTHQKEFVCSCCR